MDFIKKYAYIFLGVFCVLALGGLFMANSNRPAGVMDLGQPIGEPRPESTPPPQPEITGVQPTEPTTIMVHIVGAVYAPGVFEVPYGSRVNDVLQLAGGHTYEADLGLINLAAFVQDAMQIRVPAIGEEPQATLQEGQSGHMAVTADGRININLASLAELQTLPGIGPVIAQNIIDFREANNGFNSIEELVNVQRIGQTIFDNIRDRVTI